MEIRSCLEVTDESRKRGIMLSVEDHPLKLQQSYA